MVSEFVSQSRQAITGEGECQGDPRGSLIFCVAGQLAPASSRHVGFQPGERNNFPVTFLEGMNFNRCSDGSGNTDFLVDAPKSTGEQRLKILQRMQGGLRFSVC